MERTPWEPSANTLKAPNETDTLGTKHETDTLGTEREYLENPE